MKTRAVETIIQAISPFCRVIHVRLGHSMVSKVPTYIIGQVQVLGERVTAIHVRLIVNSQRHIRQVIEVGRRHDQLNGASARSQGYKLVE
jgi:hypothetical protein